MSQRLHGLGISALSALIGLAGSCRPVDRTVRKTRAVTVADLKACNRKAFISQEWEPAPEPPRVSYPEVGHMEIGQEGYVCVLRRSVDDTLYVTATQDVIPHPGKAGYCDSMDIHIKRTADGILVDCSGPVYVSPKDDELYVSIDGEILPVVGLVHFSPDAKAAR